MTEAHCPLKRHKGLLLAPHFSIDYKTVAPTKYLGHGTPHRPTCKPHNCLILINHVLSSTLGFLYSSVGKASICNAGDLGSIPGEGNRNPLQYSRLENPLDRGAWWAAIHRAAKSRTRLKSLSTHAQYSSVQMYHLVFIFLSMDILVGSVSCLL